MSLWHMSHVTGCEIDKVLFEDILFRILNRIIYQVFSYSKRVILRTLVLTKMITSAGKWFVNIQQIKKIKLITSLTRFFYFIKPKWWFVVIVFVVWQKHYFTFLRSRILLNLRVFQILKFVESNKFEGKIFWTRSSCPRLTEDNFY